jgi:SPP1 gp7 family putative phage head morphogenesis protein
MPNLYRTAQEFKRALLQRERKAAMRMIRIYGRAYIRIAAQLQLLMADIQEARAAGEMVNPGWLMRQQRFTALLVQVTREIGGFAEQANGSVIVEQRRAIDTALRDSQALLKVAAEEATIGATFNTINKSAVENLVGSLGDGSPLKLLFDELPRNARRIVERGLVEGVILGHNPRQIAREIRNGLGGNLSRALTIARTEVLRAYREASHETYEANADIVEGWYWVASLSERTCVACIALHGTFHPLTEVMESHPNCRCVAVPGFEDQGRPVQKGATWFRQQSADVKREILDTPGAFEAYRAGKVGIEDFVGRKRSEWGDNYYALSLKRALAGEARFPE